MRYFRVLPVHGRWDDVIHAAGDEQQGRPVAVREVHLRRRLRVDVRERALDEDAARRRTPITGPDESPTPAAPKAEQPAEEKRTDAGSKPIMSVSSKTKDPASNKR